MKLNKKFLSCFMAATMMVSPAAVFADTVDVASGTVNGTGTVHYVNTKIYNIILPTDEALDFSIDPMGLLSINGTTDLATALSNAAAAPTNVTSNATAIINKSSVPVTVNVETSINNGNSTYSVDANDVSAAAVNLVATKDDVKASNSDVSHAAMYLAITPLSGGFFTTGSIVTGPASKVADLTMDATNVANKTITGAVYTLSEASINLTNVENLDDEVVTANGSATPDSFTINLSGMPEAYNVSSASSVAILDESKAEAILASAVSASAVSYIFNITGKVDIDSDVWKQFSDDQYSWPGQQEIGLKVKFNITSAETDQTGPWNVTITQGSTSNVVVKVDQQVSSVTLTNLNGQSMNTVISSPHISNTSATNGEVTFLGAQLKGYGVGSRQYVFKFADGSTKTFTLTIQ